MLNPERPEAKLESLGIEFKLLPNQRAMLQAAVQTDWFELLQSMIEDVVRNFTVRLMQTPNEDRNLLASRHAQAQAAIELYKQFFRRIAVELDIEKTSRQMAGIGTAKNPIKPEYVTDPESIIELGIKP